MLSGVYVCCLVSYEYVVLCLCMLSGVYVCCLLSMYVISTRVCNKVSGQIKIRVASISDAMSSLIRVDETRQTKLELNGAGKGIEEPRFQTHPI